MAVHLGHLDIHENQIVALPVECRECIASVRCDGGTVTSLFK